MSHFILLGFYHIRAPISTGFAPDLRYILGMSIVYVDELFMLNAAIDYFLLLGTARLCSLPYRRGRYALAAAGGALWCCLGLLPKLTWLGGAWMKTALAMGLCLAAFGREAKLWRSTAVFLALSFLFGGAVYALGLWRGTSLPGGRLARLDLRVLLLSFALCWAGVSLVLRRCAQGEKIHTVTLTRGERTVTLRALHDTGNTLRDAVSGKRVLVAEAGALAPLFSSEEAEALRGDAVRALSELPGFRLIPYAALGGSGLLLCFRPDAVTVDGAEVSDIAAAVSPTALGGDFEAIL